MKGIKYRDLESALLRHGCRWEQGRGDHVKWYCPCGHHLAVATTAREVSPGVVGDVVKKLICLPEGWLS